MPRAHDNGGSNVRVSFVIPTRNQGSFLRQCIDSCLQQRVDDREIVVIDGASTDDTIEVLKSYGDAITWRSEPDSGQSDAINKGIRFARGELIAWINSDDYYTSPDAIPALLGELDSDVSCDIAYGDGVRVDVEGRTLGTFTSRRIDRAEEIVTHGPSFVMQPSLVFRRELFLAAGGLDEALHYAMDYDLWVRMFSRARHTRYVARPIACARYHDDAKSVNAMGAQIREVCRIKARHALRMRLGLVDLVRLQVGVAALGAYFIAVRLGLKKAT